MPTLTQPAPQPATGTAGPTLNDLFASVIAWLMIGKVATGLYDEVTRRPGTLAGRTEAPPVPVTPAPQPGP